MNSSSTSFRFLNSKNMIRLLLGIVLLQVVSIPVFAQNNVVGITEREIAKRQQALKQAEKLVGNAQKAIDDKNFEVAYGFYLEALELIPEGVANNALRTNVLTDRAGKIP